MVELEKHRVPVVTTPIRLVDYAIGIFESVTTKNAVKKAIKNQEIYLNGIPAQTGHWMKEGDVLSLTLGLRSKPKRYELDIEIVFEDEHFAVVNKPAGIPVSANQFRTLENCLIDQLKPTSQNDALDWALPVHRLDAPTSGLVIFAKTRSSRQAFGEILEQKQIFKTYHAIVQGKPKTQSIKTPIEDKTALTHLEVIRSIQSLQNQELSLVHLIPVTGRTHQLRIHCASIGHPIVGDKLHGNKNALLKHKGLFLAAVELKFDHPISSEQIQIKIEHPKKFDSYLEREERRWMKFNQVD